MLSLASFMIDVRHKSQSGQQMPAASTLCVCITLPA